MKQLWKVGLAIVAVVVLAGAAVGFVSAQTEGGVPGSDFVARLAEKLGISQEELQDAIDETGLEIVDEAVTEGNLTEEQGDRIRDRVESGDGLLPFGGFGKGFGKGFAVGLGVGHLAASLDDLADFMGIATEELRDAMAEGQSLAEVAAAQNVSEDDLKAFLLSQCEERLAEAVESGRITQERADEMLAAAPERIEQMINQEGPLCPRGGRGHWGGGFGAPFGAPAEPEAEDTTDTTL